MDGWRVLVREWVKREREIMENPLSWMEAESDTAKHQIARFALPAELQTSF